MSAGGDIAAAFRGAVEHHRAGRPRQAEGLCRQILRQQPTHPDALHLLGLLAQQAGQLDAAAELVGRALGQQPGNAVFLNSLGIIAGQKGDHERALSCLEKAVSLQPRSATAHYNLGNLLLMKGAFEEAAQAFRRCLKLKPNNIEALYNLGNALGALGRLDKAIQAYRKLLARDRRHVPALNNLGMALAAAGRPDEAAAAYQRALAEMPDDASILVNLGNALKAQHKLEEAVVRYKAALAIDPDLVEAHYNLGVALSNSGKTAEAIAAFDRAVEVRPAFLNARWARLLTLPDLYDSEAQIADHRARWNAGLRGLAEDLRLDTPARIEEAKRAVCAKTNFALAYQGYDDRAEQSRYGALVCRIASAAYPAFAEPRSKRPPEGRIRVGFLSAHFRTHTVGALFGNWVLQLPRDRFEIHGFHLGGPTDAFTRRVEAHCDSFVQGVHDERTLIETIDAANLDALVFLDIGMDPKTQLLAALRLAPVQCAAWGHPVTSGLPSVDYFLSSALMEPEDGESHYTERLVRLPNLSISYDAPDPATAVTPPGTAADKGDGPVFLCSQNLSKLLPQYDHIYPRIAARVGRCRFWFISHRAATVGEAFRRRLDSAFGHSGLQAADYVTLHPRLSHQEFLGLNRAADVLLDSVLWSGGNTSLEALACNTPVVTFPGPMMRGRHTAAMLERIGLTELIAPDLDAYVETAATLATDRAYRDATASQIDQRKGALYGDREAVRGLQDFLIEATAGVG